MHLLVSCALSVQCSCWRMLSHRHSDPHHAWASALPPAPQLSMCEEGDLHALPLFHDEELLSEGQQRRSLILDAQQVLTAGLASADTHAALSLGCGLIDSERHQPMVHSSAWSPESFCSSRKQSLSCTSSDCWGD